jgi:hypothetical protein
MRRWIGYRRAAVLPEIGRFRFVVGTFFEDEVRKRNPQVFAVSVIWSRSHHRVSKSEVTRGFRTIASVRCYTRAVREERSLSPGVRLQAIEHNPIPCEAAPRRKFR